MKDLDLDHLRESMSYARKELSKEDYDRALYIANRLYFAQKNDKRHFLNSLGQSNGKTIVFAILMKEYWAMLENSYDRASMRSSNLDNLYSEDPNLPVSADRLLEEHDKNPTESTENLDNKHFVLQYLLDEDLKQEYNDRNDLGNPKNFTVKHKALGTLFDHATVLGWEEDVLDTKNWKPDQKNSKNLIDIILNSVYWFDSDEYGKLAGDIRAFKIRLEEFMERADRHLGEEVSNISDIEDRDCLIVPEGSSYLVWEAVRTPKTSPRYADDLIGKAWNAISKIVTNLDAPFQGDSLETIRKLIQSIKMIQRVKRHLKTGFLVRNRRYVPYGDKYRAEKGVDLFEYLDLAEDRPTRCRYSIPDTWISYLDDDFDASLYISSAETTPELLKQLISGGIEELSSFPDPITNANQSKNRTVIHIDTSLHWNQGLRDKPDERQEKDLWLVRTLLEDEDVENGTISYPKHDQNLEFDDFINIYTCQGSNAFDDKTCIQIGGTPHPNPAAVLKNYLTVFHSFEPFSYDREEFNKFNIKGLEFPRKEKKGRLIGSKDDELDLIYDKMLRRKLRDVFYRLRQDGYIIYHGQWLDILEKEFGRKKMTLGELVLESKDEPWILENQEMIRDEVKQQVASKSELNYSNGELSRSRESEFKSELSSMIDSGVDDHFLTTRQVQEKTSGDYSLSSVRKWLKEYAEDSKEVKIRKSSQNFYLVFE